MVTVALLSMRRERAWKEFAAAHNCQVIAHRKGDVDIAVGTAISIGPGTSPQVSTVVAPIFEDGADLALAGPNGVYGMRARLEGRSRECLGRGSAAAGSQTHGVARH